MWDIMYYNKCTWTARGFVKQICLLISDLHMWTNMRDQVCNLFSELFRQSHKTAPDVVISVLKILLHCMHHWQKQLSGAQTKG